MSDFTIAHINLAHGFRGGERQTELLIKGLSEEGIKQYLICRKESPLIEHLNNVSGLELIAVPDKPDARLMGHLTLAKKADLIQAHETLAAHSALLHHLIFKTPYVITRRVDDRIRVNGFNRALYGKAAALVGVSSVIQGVMEKTFGVKALTIHSASSGLKVNKANVAAIKEQWKDFIVVGHAGALVDRHKGQSVLIKAIPALLAKIPNLKVVFLGRGEDLQKLREQAKGLPVEFLGFKDNVTDYISAMDVFAFPSNNEGLGSVILDAMANSVPVVASRVGGIPDLVEDGRSGLLIEKGDSDALANAILKLHDDKELRDRLVKGGLEVADDNSAFAMTKRYIALYKSVLNKD
ncbi:MAG: glycosyltransferase family 4 protein [Succinatimonas hippei]|nr:glycosyltransferase family 4 protein [Succinatimonas hippei]